MTDEDQAEDRLRQLLRDDRWSLPPWTDTQPRIRKAARRQRVTAAAAGAAAAAAITAAIVTPLTLSGTGPPKAPAVTGPTPAATHPAPPHRRYTLPPVGAPGFPTAIYPTPRRPHPAPNPLGHCPAPAGLQPFTAGGATTARAVIPKLGRSFHEDLRLTDRAFWPTILIGWQQPPGQGPAHRSHRPILYAGPLQSYHQSEGPPDFARAISSACGDRLARDTWMIVDGPRPNPALQSEWLFLTRRGHVLLYYNQ
jgi:hypothetical protein